jgi:hypothetical protein
VGPVLAGRSTGSGPSRQGNCRRAARGDGAGDNRRQSGGSYRQGAACRSDTGVAGPRTPRSGYRRSFSEIPSASRPHSRSSRSASWFSLAIRSAGAGEHPSGMQSANPDDEVRVDDSLDTARGSYRCVRGPLGINWPPSSALAISSRH